MVTEEWSHEMLPEDDPAGTDVRVHRGVRGNAAAAGRTLGLLGNL